jgi:RNA polymerase sigma factor (sigma-70 family)
MQRASCSVAIACVANGDHELLDLWRCGDNRAGSRLIERHYAALRRFLSSKAQGHTDDLIQQTFMACVESKDAFRGDSSFRAYLLGLARFQLLTHYRKFYRARDLDATTLPVNELDVAPGEDFAQREELTRLALAMQRVPHDQKIVLELTYRDGLAAPEVARVLGVPPNTVYSRLRRAKARLRAVLQQLSNEPQRRDDSAAVTSPVSKSVAAREWSPCADGPQRWGASRSP